MTRLLDSLIDSPCHCGGKCGPCGGGQPGLGYLGFDDIDTSDWDIWDYLDYANSDSGTIRIDTWEPYAPVGGGSWWDSLDWSWLFGPLDLPVYDPLISVPDQCGRLPGDPGYGTACDVAPAPCSAWVEKRDAQGNTWFECTEAAQLPDPVSQTCPPGYVKNGAYCVSAASATQRPQPRSGTGSSSGSSGSATRPSRQTGTQQLTPQQICARAGMIYDPQTQRCRKPVTQSPVGVLGNKLGPLPIWAWALILIGIIAFGRSRR